MKAYKFRISSPEQSERLQKVLFKLGYDGEEVIFNTNLAYIFAESNGCIMWDNIEYEFEEDSNKEKDTEKFIAKHSGEKNVKNSKWQSVEGYDNMPEQNKSVLVYCEDGNYHVAYHGDYGKWLTTLGDHYLYGVTYWREIPKGPSV